MKMTYRDISWSVIAGLGSGALFTTFVKGSVLSVLGVCFSPVPLIMAGLAFGFFGSLISAVAGILLLLVVTGGGAIPLYSLCDILPCLVLVFLNLRSKTDADGNKRWYPLGYTVSWLSVLSGLFAFMVVMLMTSAVAMQGQDGLNITEALKFLFNHAMTVALANNPELKVVNPKVWEELISVFMSFVAFSWFGRIIVAGFIGEVILLRMNKSLRPKTDYISFNVQNWVLIAVLLFLAIGFFSKGDVSYVSYNMAAIISIPFSFLGIASVHLLAREMKNTNLVLFLFYTLLTVSVLTGGSLTVFIVMAILGIFEQLSRLYKSYKLREKEKK